MNSSVTSNITRFFLVIIIQVFVFQSAFINFPLGKYLFVFFYPLFILLLPVRTPPVLTILLAFILGIIIDLFANSLGIHTSALVFMAFLRPYILNFLEPRKRYDVLAVPSSRAFGIGWFTQYTGILILFHCLFYYSVDAFTFRYFFDILLKTIISGGISLLCIIIYQLIFDPKQ